jgi:copper chaperone
MKIAVLILSLIVGSAFAARVEVEVTGMSCGMCVEHITKQLKSTEKAENISVSLEEKRTRFTEVKGKRLSDSEIRAAIKKAGYEATKITRKN